MKKIKNKIESLRLMSNQLPGFKNGKQSIEEINFDIDWCVEKTKQYSIDENQDLCLEEWQTNTDSNEAEFISLKKMKITQDFKIQTEINGKEVSFSVTVKKGKVKSIKKVKS